MLIRHIDGANGVLGAPPDWNGVDMSCGALPVRKVQTSEGVFLVSAWEPTPIELAALNAGETIKLWVRGEHQHPVVAMTVGDLQA